MSNVPKWKVHQSLIATSPAQLERITSGTVEGFLEDRQKGFPISLKGGEWNNGKKREL